MTRLDQIRAELEQLIEERAELWEALAEAHDPVKSAEAARLSQRIDQLWAESRNERARARFGPSEDIISRARAEDRLEREARRLRRAA
jgi:hypothetical protein